MVGFTNSAGKAFPKYQDWKPQTWYSAGDIVVYEGQAYSVTSGFTSGSMFSDTNLTAFLPIPLTSAQMAGLYNAYNTGFNGGVV